jgi:hypothetical protein
VNKWLQQQFTVIITDCFEVFGLAAAQIVQNSKVHVSLDIDSDFGDSKSNIKVKITNKNV